MTLNTTDRFISASAAGTDWRDTARAVLEKLESVRIEHDGFNIGFIYISDVLADQAENILDLFKAVTKIDYWTGATAAGICTVGSAYAGEPAISVLLGRFDGEQFRTFSATDSTLDEAAAVIEPWLSGQDVMLTLVHTDGTTDFDMPVILQKLDYMIGGFTVGGVSSGHGKHVQFSDHCVSGGVSGVAFSGDVQTVTALTQGCAPMGKTHKITRCDRNVIMELDGQRALDVLSQDLQSFAADRAALTSAYKTDEMTDENNCENTAPDNQSLFKGEINVAFSVHGADLEDYLVRPVMGIDSDNGWVSVGAVAEHGDRVVFVQRDDQTLYADLSRTLLDLRTRVKKDHGVFNPKGALYISCVARAGNAAGDEAKREMGLVQDIIGDVPLAGFYAYGEISHRRLYGYTGILILFL